MSNLFALVITLILSILWLRINDLAAQHGWISGRLSRKIIHIGTGPLFVLCWLLFSPALSARYLAATVPLLITIQFFLVGIGVLKDEAAVQAMSRTGDRRELLRGPLIYGLMFVVLTIWFWKDSPVGMVALMLLCGGDGLADIVGRRWGRTHSTLEQRQNLGRQPGDAGRRLAAGCPDPEDIHRCQGFPWPLERLRAGRHLDRPCRGSGRIGPDPRDRQPDNYRHRGCARAIIILNST